MVNVVINAIAVIIDHEKALLLPETGAYKIKGWRGY
jgi:hypothetical protein